MEIEEEPKTAITRKVEKAVEDSELKRNRRWHDRIYNDVIQPMIVPTIFGIVGTIIAIVTTLLGMWVDMNTMKIEMQQFRKTLDSYSERDSKTEQLGMTIEQLTAELKRQQSGVGKR